MSAQNTCLSLATVKWKAKALLRCFGALQWNETVLTLSSISLWVIESCKTKTKIVINLSIYSPTGHEASVNSRQSVCRSAADWCCWTRPTRWIVRWESRSRLVPGQGSPGSSQWPLHPLRSLWTSCRAAKSPGRLLMWMALVCPVTCGVHVSALTSYRPT